MEREPGSWAGSDEVVISDGTTKGYHLRLFHFYPQDPVTPGIPGTRKPSGAEVGEHCEDAAVILNPLPSTLQDGQREPRRKVGELDHVPSRSTNACRSGHQ